MRTSATFYLDSKADGAGVSMRSIIGDQQESDQAKTGGHEVFVSYSSKNKKIVDAIVADFERNGIKCWYAPRDILPGEPWAAAITRALENAKVMLLVFTSESNSSHQVMNEINLAASANKVIVPFRLTQEQMNDQLAYYLARYQWVDGVEGATFNKDVERLRDHVMVIKDAEEASSSESQTPMQEQEAEERIKEAKWRMWESHLVESERNKTPGLWWKVLNLDGAFSVFPKTTWFWSVMVIAATIAVLLVVPRSIVAYLGIPLLLVSLNLTSASLAGDMGIKFTEPLAAYGFSAIFWRMVYSGAGSRQDIVPLAIIVAAFFAVRFACLKKRPMEERNGEDAAFFMMIIVTAIVSLAAYLLRQGTISVTVARIIVGICYVVSFVEAMFLCVNAFKAMYGSMPYSKFKRRLTEGAVLFGLGVVPVVLAGALSFSPLLALLVAIVVYAGLAVVADRWVLRTSRDQGMLLVPLLVAGTICLLAQSSAKGMPLSSLLGGVIAWCKTNGLAGLLTAGAAPIMQAFTGLFGGAVRSILKTLVAVGPKARIPLAGVGGVSLSLGILVIASVMGAAVSGAEVFFDARQKDESDASEQD